MSDSNIARGKWCTRVDDPRTCQKHSTQKGGLPPALTDVRLVTRLYLLYPRSPIVKGRVRQDFEATTFRL
jgi:hypothetical protein